MSDDLSNAHAWEDSIKKCDDLEVVATLKELRTLSVPPADADAYNTWLEAGDAMRFLVKNAESDWIVIYSALFRPHTLLIHGVLVPRANISPPNVNDLLMWSYNPFHSWSWVSDESKTLIEPPLAMSGSETMKEGEQLVLGRTDFAGNSYFDISQRFAHMSNLHYVEEQSSWCIKGQRGDIEPAVYLAADSAGYAVLFRRDVLSDYASLTDAVMVRMFDFPRHNDSFIGWGSTSEERKAIDGQKIYARRLVAPHYASYHKGVQISEIAVSSKEAANTICGMTDNKDKKYAAFIALDWKNRRVEEISCSPDASVNYFTKSNLPFELSPAFFRAEVLSKYKANSEKYEVTEYSVRCPERWSLDYSVNPAGQVVAYLCDLRWLPYDEQLYWKSFNDGEHPKPRIRTFKQHPLLLLRSVLSETAFKAHFEGRWDLEIDVLQVLKQTLMNLQCEWWRGPPEGVLERLNYPRTKSLDDWSREIIALSNVIIEGLVEKELRLKAQKLGRKQGELEKLRTLQLVC